MTRALLEQALEALQWEHGGEPLPTLTAAAINAIIAELAKPNTQQAPQVPMTEDEIIKCLVESSCIGKVMMSFESGPYDITRTSINADRLVRAIEAHHGIKEWP